MQHGLRGGNIMVETTDESKPKAIFNHDHLEALLYETSIPSSDEEYSDFDFDIEDLICS